MTPPFFSIFESCSCSSSSAMAATNSLRTRAQKRKRAEAEEAKKGKNLATMPPLVLHKVAERLEHYDRIAFASTCTTFSDAIEEVNKEGKEGEERKKLLVTVMGNNKLLKKAPCFTLDWFKWVHGSFARGFQRGLQDSDLMQLAAFQGSIETMKWLKSEGIPLETFPFPAGHHAAMGGQIEMLEWLRSEGYEFRL